MTRIKYAGIVLLSVLLMVGCVDKDSTYNELTTKEENKSVRVYYIDDATAEPGASEL